MTERARAATLRSIEAAGGSLRFFLRSLRTSATLGRGVWRFRLPLVLEQVRRTGVMSLPIVVLVAGLIGFILVLQTAYQLAKFGQVDLVASLVGVSVTRELGPLMTAIIVTGRVGAAFTAELGTMKVNQEILAAETMAIDPVEFLVVPRQLALVVVLPCLATIANYAAIGTALVAGHAIYGIATDTFLHMARESIQATDVIHTAVKSVCFAAIISHVCCHAAFRLRGGAAGVGIATMRAVVTSIVLVLVTDAAFTALTR